MAKYRITAQRTAEEIVRAIVAALTPQDGIGSNDEAIQVVERTIPIVTEIIIQETRPRGAK